MGVPEEGLSVALIELDLPAPPPSGRVRPPVHRYRVLGLVLAGLLVLTLGGAAPGAPVRWRHLGSVPLPAGSLLTFTVSGDRLYAATVTGDRRVTSAWRLDPTRPAWTVTVPGGEVGDGYLEPAGDLLLQNLDPQVAVLDAATGATRWTAPVPVQVLSGRTGLVRTAAFAPGTEYDTTSGDPGQLYFSADGRPYTQPPRYTDLEGVDLATGRRRWKVREPGSVYAAAAPDASGAVLVVSAQAIDLRDGTTGGPLRRRALPRADPREVWYAEVTGDLVLVRQGRRLTAYRAGTLEQRWTTVLPPDDVQSGFCFGVLCQRLPDGIAILDPETGRAAWRAGVDVNLTGGGGEVLETRGSSGRPVRIRDAATGATRTDLSAWDTVVDYDTGRDLLVYRYDPALQTTAFGLRAPGAAVVRSLGVSEAPLRDCRASDRLVACRGVDHIEVFAYRE
jgi:outer membrane protein assembly factor BamB